MIKKIIVTSSRGKKEFDLLNPNGSLLIKDISGLGPTTSSISITRIGNTDYSNKTGSKRESRNITMELVFNSMSVEYDRHEVYTLFPVEDTVKIEIITDERHIFTTGIVESNEPNIFSAKEKSNISILCPNPYFKSKTEKIDSQFSTIEPNFEFPFSNESLTEPKIEFAIIKKSTIKNVYYTGEIESGMTITIDILGPIGDLTIYDNKTKNYFKILKNKLAKLGFTLQKGDTIVIQTSIGNKKCYLYRDSIPYNILNTVEYNNWLTLKQGDNVISYHTDSGIANMSFAISADVLYEGV